jgi:hypothetical protein
MISTGTQKQLETLFANQDSYRPSPEIVQQLQDKTIVMLVGATCEGKNTVMEAVTKLDAQFRISGRFTSREPRAGDDPNEYTYFENSDQGLAPLLADIDQYKVVQYVVNPHAGLIYGTMPSDYAGTYNLSDIFSSGVETFHQLGFQRSLAVTIISTTDVWRLRFDERFPLGHPQRKARRDEAIESFTWSLNQPMGKHFWVENIDGDPMIAAKQVQDICLHNGHGQPDARQLAQKSLEYARTIAV